MAGTALAFCEVVATLQPYEIAQRYFPPLAHARPPFLKNPVRLVVAAGRGASSGVSCDGWDDGDGFALVASVALVAFCFRSAMMRASSILLRTGGEAGAGHALAQAALLQKILLQAAE